MTSRHTILATVLAISSQLLSAPTPTLAQELEEVVVTAQRREQNLQETAVSITAFTADRLNDLGISDPQMLADYVPNLSMGDGTGRGSGGTQISIRGVNEARISPVLDPAVGIYIDDVYYGRPQTAFLKLLDVERIEVLRGPQGTLFGKNSTGGAVRYITNRPDFDGTSGYIDATVGDYNRMDLKGAINLTLSDTTAVRFSAASMSRDGYVKRLSDGIGLGDEDTQFVSGKLRYIPTDRLVVHLGFDYTQRSTDDGPTKLIDYHNYNTTTDTTAGGPLAVSPGSNAVASWNAQWGGSVMEYNPIIPANLYQVGGEGLLGINESESLGLRMSIQYEINDSVTLRSITGYRSVDENTTFDRGDQAGRVSFFNDTVKEGVDFWSQEFQLTGLSFDDRLTWVGGTYYSVEEPFRIELEDRDGRLGPGSRGALMANDTAHQETKSFGVFAQGTYAISEQLGLTLGVRHTRDDKNYTVSQVLVWDFELDNLADQLGLTDLAPVLAGPGSVRCDPSITGSCVSNAGVSGGDTFSSTTPRFALEYQWSDDVMTYAAASKGFKSGGTNDSVADINTPFAPEELWSYEVGLRSDFFDNRARLNVTYFTMDYEDKQITVTADPICTRRCTTNVGDAEISGWEIEGIGFLSENFSVNFGIGLLDAKWKDIANPTAGVTLDSWFSRAPDVNGSFGARYETDLASGGGLAVSLDYAFSDDQRSSPQDSTSIEIPSYGLLNGRLTYTSQDQTWDLSVFCTNCADEKYITGGAAWSGATDNTHPMFNYKPSTFYGFVNGTINLNTAPPGITIVNVGLPRMVGATFRYHFGES